VSSGVLRCVVWWKLTDVSDYIHHANRPGNEGSKHLWNVGQLSGQLYIC
jgi:hypothetical protein